MASKKILITGAAGFLGSHLCDRFIKEGFQVIGMDNLITGDLKNIEHLFPLKEFEFYHHDVSKFIHGYSVLSETAEVFYKCDEFYNRSVEGGIIYNDAELGIDWMIPAEKAIVSEKDKAWPGIDGCSNNFIFVP